MSFQASTWAIEQRTGSPSAKSTLWSIANYANEYWCSFPKQETISWDSEQSVDSVGKRIGDLVAHGLVRRIKLKRYGRRTHDFLILQPSRLFGAPLEEIIPHLPSGCEVMIDRSAASHDTDSDAAADCGSVDQEKSGLETAVSSPHAAADCGSVENPETPPTLPQSAVDATALVREHEPVTNQESPPISPSHLGGAPLPARAEREPVPEPIGFAAFWAEYPDHAIDNRIKAASEFTALSETDRIKATDAATLYGRDIRKRERRPVGAWRWLKERRFSEYQPGAGKSALGRVFVPDGGEAWQAWCAVAALAFGGGPKIPTFWAGRGPHGERGAMCPAAWPLGGEGWLVPLEHWVFVERDTAQFRRWNERINEILARPIVMQPGGIARRDGRKLIARDGATWDSLTNPQGCLVPSEWPPAKGTHRERPGNDPPGELSDQDADAFVKTA